ncbi:hypothetical protein BDZ97DRAFT_1922555 [Flammula alnicola]|nr:hypothetical protein BDZ97DRAFT_1922555 [Flammula alnicola]
MFELRQDPNIVQDDSTDEQPIRLEGVKKEEFKRILMVMYAWISDRWEMEHLRKLAIDKPTPSFATDAHKLAFMGHKYIRDDPMDEGDANEIGATAALKRLCRVWPEKSYMPTTEDIMPEIRVTFGLEED